MHREWERESGRVKCHYELLISRQLNCVDPPEAIAIFSVRSTNQ